MTPEEKMLLYYVNLFTDAEGEYVVGRNDIASLLNVSVVTANKRMKNLVLSGLVASHKKPLARGLGYKWIFHITQQGIDSCHKVWDEALELYRAHQNTRLYEAIEEAKKMSRPRGNAKKISDKQLVLL